MQQIPNFDLKNEIEAKRILQQYGMADFKNTVLRNFAKDYIEKQAALLSVTELTSIVQPVDSLNVIINASPAGGVKTQYPIESGVGKQGQVDAINIVGTNFGLRRANTTYSISHEVNAMGSAAITRNDLVLEAAEQLGAKMDYEYITALVVAKFADNDVVAPNTWDALAGDPYTDINKAIGLIQGNSAVPVNNLQEKAYTVIAPIEAKVAMNKPTVIDGILTTLNGQIESRLSTQIVYTRQPFFIDETNTPWPLTTSAIVIPTKDRHVGKFYTFNGNGMPSLWETSDEDGVKVSQNSWMKYKVAPNEKSGEFTDNRRISVITDILA
jgi:hypothetical protein